MRRLYEDFDEDVPVPLSMKIDALVRLFDGDVTLSEILKMDIPFQKSLVQARLEALRRSQELLAKQGIIDSYSRRYANSMAGSFGGGPSLTPSTSSTSPETDVDESPPAQSNSLNLRAMRKN